MSSLVVTGAAGQLGTAFAAAVPEATFLGREDLDLAETTALAERLTRLRPSAVINCAAYTAVDQAEDDERRATLINGTAVAAMAEATAALGIPFVTFSTDYVFDGQASVPYVESSPTGPLNAYGRSKLVGELAALQANPRALVIRTSWLVSGTHRNFVASILAKARAGTASVVDDQWGSPTVTDDLVSGTLHALDAAATGLLHLANSGSTTWFGLARHAVRLAGFAETSVLPVDTTAFPTRAVRPTFGVLGSERVAALGLTPLPRWEEPLAPVVERLLRPGGVVESMAS